MVRATAADAQIRAFAATTKNLVEEMRSLHNTSPVVSAALGRLLTGGALMGAMMKGENDLLTLQIKGDGPIGGMTVTADAHRNVKGYANEAQVILPANAAGKLDVGSAVGKGILRVVKDMGLKEPYVGQTILQTGEIAEDLTYYFAVSEQTPSSVGLGVFMEKNNTVKQAGGFILQLMPYAEESVITRLEDNLRQFPSVTAALEAGKNPEQMLEALLDGLPMEIVDTMDVQYRCDCSKQRVERAMISLGKKELEEMIAEGKEVEAGCQFCNQKYKFTVEELERLIL